MSRQVEDFSAELTVPEIFREVCALMLAVGRTCVIRATSQQESDDDEAELVIHGATAQSGMLVWVHMSAAMMFADFSLTRRDSIEVFCDTLAHAFRSDQGLLAMNEIRLKISRRGGAGGASAGGGGGAGSDGLGSHGTPIGRSAAPARLISVKMYNKNIDGLITKAVEQRVYGEAIEEGGAPSEPVHDGVAVWADLHADQLEQMAKASDQFKQMSPLLEVALAPTGEFRLAVRAPSVAAVSTFAVEFAQRVDASPPHESQGSAAAAAAAARCSVLARDWCVVMHARRLFRRVVLGVLNNEVVVVYGFLRQGVSPTSDSANFYLAHRANT